MGGKASKAKKVCVTESTTTLGVDADAESLSSKVKVNVTKKYDTQCVSEQLKQLKK